MPKIRFTRAYRVKPDGPDYAEGQVVEVSEASARHFLNRQAAVEVEGGGVLAPAAAPKQAGPAPAAPPPDHPAGAKPDEGRARGR